MDVLTGGTWSLGVAMVAFAAAATAVGVFGARLARVVDELADRTGIGEALAGAVLLGAVTSIAGLVASVVAAADGNASLAISNSVGGIAVQTAFIVAADIVYRRANIEHAAASLVNVFHSLLMVVLLAIVLMAIGAPEWTVLSVHPASVVLIVAYVYGLRLGRTVGRQPMWQPTPTRETRLDEPDEKAQAGSLGAMVARFAALGAVITVAGWVVGRAGLSVVEATGFSGTAVGIFFTSTTTSLPELVTAVAAVRSGALTLAIGGIVGGNTFDVLFIAVSDGVFREGSLYAAADRADVFVVGWTMLLVAILAAGLVRRERRGIGFEGISILAVYAAGLVVVTLIG